MSLLYNTFSKPLLFFIIIFIMPACSQDISSIRPNLSSDLQYRALNDNSSSLLAFDTHFFPPATLPHGIQIQYDQDLEVAFLSLARGDIEAAERLFSDALGRNPQNSYAMSGLGFVRLLQNRPTDALRLANQAISLNQNNFLAENLAGFSLLVFNQNEKAKEHFDRSKKLAPNNTDADIGLSIIDIKTRKYDNAISTLSSILNRFPNNNFARMMRGWAFFNSMRFSESEMDLLMVFSSSPNDFLINAALGSVHLLQGTFKKNRLNIGNLSTREAQEDFRLADSFFSRAIAIKNDDVGLLRSRALARRQIGNLSGAISDLTSAIVLRPNEAILYAERARIYMEIGRPQDAERDAEHARRLGLRGL